MGMFTEKWLPAVDISETKDGLIVKAELPCLDAKDVNVSISGDLLTMKGEKKKEDMKCKTNRRSRYMCTVAMKDLFPGEVLQETLKDRM